MKKAVILLAAGQGKRMKSSLPKVLHPLCGKPMVYFLNKAVGEMRPDRFVIVVSPRSENGVKQEVNRKAEIVVQGEPLGTGHAVIVAREQLRDFTGPVLVICGDTPLLSSGTMKGLLKTHVEKKAVATVLTAKVESPRGYGRIIRGNGGIKKIVEESDATPSERHIREINTGTYCFEASVLFDALNYLKPTNVQNEYYLTDIIGMYTEQRLKVVAHQVEDETEILGVNSRIELADAEMIIRERINDEHMSHGVRVIHPALTYIDADVKIGKDTTVFPLTFLNGKTSIGEGCSIGPSTRITDSIIGSGCSIEFSVVNDAKIAKDVRVGPYTHIRPGTKVSNDAKIGSFVEIKKTMLGKGSKVPHLAYIGDADIGDDVNVGAGTITCNYDGIKKNKTVIGGGAFIGSDTILVAPIRIGKKAYTGAGSTLRRDVPDSALGYEYAEQRVKEDWVKKRRTKKS